MFSLTEDLYKNYVPKGQDPDKWLYNAKRSLLKVGSNAKKIK